MPSDDVVSEIQLSLMPQLVEAVSKEDDWTGVTDAATRRKIQNRLNVRAHRRRKALQAETQSAAVVIARGMSHVAKSDDIIPCWAEEQQMVYSMQTAVVDRLRDAKAPLIPYHKSALAGDKVAFQKPSSARIVFPLSSDHLITLLQYNALRATLVNLHLIFGLAADSVPVEDCSSAALRVFKNPPGPNAMPPAFYPTELQLTMPHESWVDVIPCPRWRDNVLMAIGTFDEDALWSDTIGGLFEGYPDDEIEVRGVIAWSPPWDISGWEVTEGFWRRWGWQFKGCGEVLDATNRWRRMRGEEPLVFKL